MPKPLAPHEAPPLDKEAILRAMRRLSKKLPPEPLPQASPELWPGEDMSLGGFTIASSPQMRLIRARYGGVV